MIVDSSAIMAVLFDEPDAAAFAAAIVDAPICRISAADDVESAVVIQSQNPLGGARQFDTFLRRANIVIEAVDFARTDIESARTAGG